MTTPDTVSLEYLARQQALLLEEVKATRVESREVRRTFTLISEHFSRQERRIGELRDDIETMLKLEVGGSIANFETRIEVYFDGRVNALESRLESHLESLESRFNGLERGQTESNAKLEAILAAVRPA